MAKSGTNSPGEIESNISIYFRSQRGVGRKDTTNRKGRFFNLYLFLHFSRVGDLSRD